MSVDPTLPLALAAALPPLASALPGSPVLLAVKGLACQRGGRRVFADISFTLSAGGALLVTGPNGTGKTSLLRLLAGLGAPAAGTISIVGNHRYLGHHNALKRVLSVRENLGYAAGLMGATARSDSTGATLEALGLAALADVPVRLLSQGQQRRVALARTLDPAASVWLLDEPTVGLDAATVAQVSALLQAHLARGGAVVAATHLDLGLSAGPSAGLGAGPSTGPGAGPGKVATLELAA
jgi:heme exporter protein A